MGSCPRIIRASSTAPRVKAASRLWDEADLVVSIGSTSTACQTQTRRSRSRRACSPINLDVEDASGTTASAMAVVLVLSFTRLGFVAGRGCARVPAWPRGSLGPAAIRSSTVSAGEAHDPGRDGSAGAGPTRPRGAADRRALSFVVVVGASGRCRRRQAGLRLPRLPPGCGPPAERPAAVRHELPDDRRLRAFLLSADVRAADPAVRAAVGDDGRLGLDGDPDRVIRRRESRSSRSAARFAGGSSSSPACRGRSPTRSSSARSGRSCSCCSRSAGAGSTTRSGSARARRWARPSSSSRRSSSSGRS